jgi:hypothetical protein
VAQAAFGAIVSRRGQGPGRRDGVDRRRPGERHDPAAWETVTLAAPLLTDAQCCGRGRNWLTITALPFFL